MIYHYATGGRITSNLIINNYSDNIRIYLYITGGRNSNLTKYFDNGVSYHYITGGRRNSKLIKISDNIMIT